MKLFDYDGPFASAFRTIFNFLVLNFCFAVSSIPIFTIGAAATALYSIFLNEGTGSSLVTRYFQAFRENFKHATLIWLLVLLVATVLCVNFYLFFAVSFPGNEIVFILTVIISVVFLSAAAFAFPLLAHYSNTLKKTIQNALILGSSGIIYGVIMIAVTFFPVIIFFISATLFVDILPFIILFSASVGARINTILLKIVFRKIESVEQTH